MQSYLLIKGIEKVALRPVSNRHLVSASLKFSSQIVWSGSVSTKGDFDHCYFQTKRSTDIVEPISRDYLESQYPLFTCLLLIM